MSKLGLRLIPIVALGWLGLVATRESQAVTYTWNGLGRTGGTEGTNWLDAANWLTNGLAAETPPTTNDTVTLAFNSNVTSRPVPVLLIPEGAEGGDVTLTGGGMLPNYGVRIAGTCLFASFFWNQGANSKIQTLSGVSMTLFAGSASVPTYKQADGFDFGSGSFLFTGTNVFISFLSLVKSFPGTCVFTNPLATINWLGSSGQRLAGPVFRFLPTQSIVSSDSTPAFLQIYGANNVRGLQSLDPEQPLLTNMFNVDLHANINSGSGGTMLFAGGTYRSLLYRYAGNDNNNYWSKSLGNITIKGGKTFTDAYITNYAFMVYRSTTKSATQGGMNLGGFNVTVESTSPVYIGNPGSGGGMTNASVLIMTNSVITAPGHFIVGQNGVLNGNGASVLKVGGDFKVLTDATVASSFVMSNTTLFMNGQGTGASPQVLEVRSSAGAGPTNNFAFGSLIVGEAGLPTTVRLANGSGTNEGLYLTGALVVTNGSTLDFGGIPVTAWQGLLADGAVTGPGLLDGNLAFTPAGSFSAQLTAPGSVDSLAVNGTVSLNGSLAVTVDGAYTPQAGDECILISNDGTDPVSGEFTNHPFNTLLNIEGNTFRLRNNGGDGNDVTLSTTGSAGALLLIR